MGSSAPRKELEKFDLKTDPVGFRYVTLQEFCRLEEITYQTALRWVKLNRLKTRKHGKERRVYYEDLERFYNLDPTFPAAPEQPALEPEPAQGGEAMEQANDYEA